MRDNYKASGVDVEAGYQAVEQMKKHIARTKRSETIGDIGSFGGLFQMDLSRFDQPILVSGTDGVGTKLLLAMAMDKLDTIGIDAVAMVVNDIIAQGAEPLLFLDYLAVGKNDPDRIEQIVAGVAEGCVQANAAIVGGETAEMPDMYADDEFDLAGFAVGAVNKADLIEPTAVKAGDVLIGLTSSGVHSNGYSLVRKVLFKDNDYQLDAEIPELDGKRLGDVLLEPTKIYVKAVLAALKIKKIHGISHITGGGFAENIPRMLPDSLTFKLSERNWPIPPIFPFLQSVGNLTDEEMYGVFNMGIGMVLAVDKDATDQVLSQLATEGEQAYIIGEIIEKDLK